MLEVSVVEGDVVASIKQQDPMGNSEVWFVDSGGKILNLLLANTEFLCLITEKQGFLPSRCLQPLFNASAVEDEKMPPSYQQVVDSNNYADNVSFTEDIYEEIPDFQVNQLVAL